MQSANKKNNLWVITSYFNPVGYKSRLANYKVFRERLSVPLLTVEQAQEGHFALDETDADILLQVPAGDVMFQKECLLNLALESLPEACEYVAWLDCDILFERDDWVDLAVKKLERTALVQLFSHVSYLRNDVDLSRPLSDQTYLCLRSTASAIMDGTLSNYPYGKIDKGLETEGFISNFSNGLAWVMRREQLARCGFYDASIIGGGDYKFLQAACGNFGTTKEAHAMNDRQYDHYLEWGAQLHELVWGNLGAIRGELYHLWHGEIANRKYGTRRYVMLKNQFDPYLDIVKDEHGCWRWNSDKPALHQALRDYFLERREDG